MTKEEFAEIIKPLSLIDNPKHREFIRQVLTGNFNRWNESKVKNLSSNTVLCDENCDCDFELLNDTGVQKCKKCGKFK